MFYKNEVLKSCLLKLLFICLSASMVFAYSGGTGEPNTPYQISSKDDLLALAATPADYGKCFILTADIDMTGQVFTTAIIAPDTDPNYVFHGTPFTGTFDGSGHKITHFTINGPGNSHLALFGQINSGGSVKNLGIENCSISSSSYFAGSLVGDNGGSISNCYSMGAVSGFGYVGGLSGYNSGTITNCYSTSTVSGAPSYEVGGLVGANDGSISNCYATGAVNSNDYVGGLVGWNYDDGSISNCYSTGTVSGSQRVGGLVGENYGGISNCYATGIVSGDSDVGGLVGEHWNGSITNCYSTGNVSGSAAVGGLVGSNESWISTCYSMGTVSGSGAVGGLVGHNGNSIYNCYSIGAVNGSTAVGGLVGIGYNGSRISNCYSTGTVSGDYEIGGLVGSNIGCGGGSCDSSINNCYSTGTVIGSADTGGLVGYSNSAINNSFWDVNSSGWSTSAGGTGKTTAQMKTLSTFTSAGWDFLGETVNGTQDVWRMCSDGADYPRFTREYYSQGDFVCPDGVDFFDFAVLADDWRLNGPNLRGDITGDLQVDFKDLLIFADNWLGCIIKPAGYPNPADGAKDISLNVILRWSSARGAFEHDVYLGTDANAIAQANHSSPQFMNTVSQANFSISSLDSNITYFWRIDEISPRGCTAQGNVWKFTTGPPIPGQASNPTTADGAVDVAWTQDLSWTAGSSAASHDVYFGTINPPPFMGNQTTAAYDTGTMTAGTTYYWRIDEENAGGTTTGTVWSFTTETPLPGATTNPVPANGDKDIDPNNIVLSWTAGAYAVSHDVYLGTAFSDVNIAGTSSPEFKGNRTATNYDPCSNLDVNTTYYWRIDEKNITGTTKGIIWNFKTWFIKDPNLVGWWKFDEGSGTIANDSSGHNNGTVNGAAVWTTGRINGSLNFDGSNDYVSVPDNDNSLDIPSQITISAWVKPNNRSNYYCIAAKQPSGTAPNSSSGNYDFRIAQTSGTLQFLHQTGTGATNTAYVSTSAVTAGVWQHVAVTLKKGDSVKFYINGASAGTLSQTAVFGIVNNNPLRIGSRADSLYWFNGPMDDIRIYNRALSGTEVQQIYQQGSNP